MTKKPENKITIPGVSQVASVAKVGTDGNVINQAVQLPGKVVKAGVEVATAVATAPGKILGAVAVAPYAGAGDSAVGVFNKLDSNKTGQVMGALGNTTQNPNSVVSQQSSKAAPTLRPSPSSQKKRDEDEETKFGM